MNIKDQREENKPSSKKKIKNIYIFKSLKQTHMGILKPSKQLTVSRFGKTRLSYKIKSLFLLHTLYKTAQ